MKRKTHFHFKQFTVRHDCCTMKVGTDAVLLGAWAVVNNAKSILDIGTGSGIIALMAAQRTGEIRIDAIEIESFHVSKFQSQLIQTVAYLLRKHPCVFVARMGKATT